MKTSVTFSAVLVGVLTLTQAPSAFAWGDMGHEIVGAVAEQTIAPSTKDWLRGLMGIEPLEVSAVFPDHVRDDDRFGHKENDVAKRGADNHDFGDYHFCEIPTGYTYDTRPNKPAKDCYGAIQGSIALLKNEKAPREERQLALRYLVHVMGDITQPLHIGNGYDLGGNSCQVNVQESPDRNALHTNLHSFWDENIVVFLGQTYANPDQKIGSAKYLNQYMSALQRLRPEMLTASAKAQYAVGDLKAWMQEAQVIRENGLYPDDPSTMAGVKKGDEYKVRPYCLWFTDQSASILSPGSVVDKSKIPTLDLAYEKKWAPVVEQQLLVGGLRLAATLDAIAATSQLPRVNDTFQEKVFADVQNAFRSAGESVFNVVNNRNNTKKMNVKK